MDEGVLDRLVVFSKKLTKLTIRSMHLTSEHNRKQLILMSDKIMNIRPPLTHIDFFYTSKEFAQQGEPLLRAIASIRQPTLSYLDFGCNKFLWMDGAKFDMLLDVLQQQHNLDHLYLNYS